MADRVKNIAVEEAERVKALATDAVKSQAYLYPVKVVSPSSSSRPKGYSDRLSGSRILCRTSQSLASSGLEAHPNNLSCFRRYNIHVRLCIFTASSCHGFYIRTGRRNLSRTADFD